MKWLIFLVAVVLVAWLLIPLFAPAPSPLTKEQAIQAAKDDARSSSSMATLRVIDARQVNNQWLIDMQLIYDANTACPRINQRNYQLLPIRYREEVILKDCNRHTPLVYPEDALIASSTLTQLSKSENSIGCAYNLEKPEQGNCPISFNQKLVTDLSSRVSTNAWLVQWTAGDKQELLALDSYGNLLAKAG